ncbi:murein transglycosylase A [Altererythrobacter sp. ZODW24]|uniref:murein transglycosylase A n=1 Tax=Altererythrobacter sp. ZODW24 TaxID=2185142 RepID=UPI000DF7A787|nr:murein transglycosylase A [Altererythrobacter sp. ZODW24]
MALTLRGLGLTAAIALLGGCSSIIPESNVPTVPAAPAPAPVGATAFLAGVSAGPSIAALSLSIDDGRTALASFIESCPRVLSRNDQSGLTRNEDWQAACAAAPGWPVTGAPKFFDRYFESVQVGEGTAFATGYFEPEISGVRNKRAGFDVPVYRVPDDLVRDWPADTPESERTGRAPLGRYDASGKFVPYYDRTEIEEGALSGRGLEIGWAADPVEMFFLQIQGSGRLRAPDGSVVRIGYAGQNGRGYTGIGGVMRERGLLGDGPGQYPGSMQGIVQYIRENPEDGKELMRLNQSWIFFTELTGDGPLGALSVPVRRESSVAADPKYVPLGAPVWLQLDRNEANGLWIAQDTGGAIKGANRFDTFWGAGDDAREIAGGMSGRGKALLLLPKPSVKRLLTR